MDMLHPILISLAATVALPLVVISVGYAINNPIIAENVQEDDGDSILQAGAPRAVGNHYAHAGDDEIIDDLEFAYRSLSFFP